MSEKKKKSSFWKEHDEIMLPRQRVQIARDRAKGHAKRNVTERGGAAYPAGSIGRRVEENVKKDVLKRKKEAEKAAEDRKKNRRKK